MTPQIRKLMLTAHVVSTVGWMGVIAAFLALAIAGLTSHDGKLVDSAYVAMKLIGWRVIGVRAFGITAIILLALFRLILLHFSSGSVHHFH